MINKFKSLRIRSQIFIAQLISMTLFSTILALCIYFFYSKIFNTFSNEAEKSLIMNLIYRQTTIQLSTYTKNLQYKVASGLNSIENFNLFNELLQSNNISFAQQTSKCLQEEYFENSYINYCQYCYGVFDCSQQLNVQTNYKNNFKNLSNLLTQMIPYQNEYNLYFTSISSDCYFSTCPGSNFTGYVPSSRKWFKNHIEKMNSSQYIISEPYVNFFGGVYLTGTTSLMMNGKQVGIIAIDLNFSNIYQFKQNDQQLLVIDDSGRVLISNTYSSKSSELQYLQNQSLFGFNDTQVQYLINNTSHEFSKCNLQIPDTICLENQNTGNFWYFKKTYITNNYIALLMFNSNVFETYVVLLNETIESLMRQSGNFLFFGLIGIILIKLIIYFFTFIILQKPIEKLVYSFNKYLLTGNRIRYFFDCRDTYDQLDKLQEAFFRLAMNFNSALESKRYYNIEENFQHQYPINPIFNSQILNHSDSKLLQNYSQKLNQYFIINFFFKNENNQYK